MATPLTYVWFYYKVRNHGAWDYKQRHPELENFGNFHYGAMIRGGSDVRDREGSIELRDLIHNLSIPTDGATGKLTGTRQHSAFSQSY